MPKRRTFYAETFPKLKNCRQTDRQTDTHTDRHTDRCDQEHGHVAFADGNK